MLVVLAFYSYSLKSCRSHRRVGGHFTDNGTSENLHPGRAGQASAVDTHISYTGFREVVALSILMRDLERKAYIAT